VEILSFKDWIARYENEDSPIGDLARDMARDKRLPEEYKDLRKHMVRMGACEEALQAATAANKRYLSYVSYHRKSIDA
jgi:hypothetical protein